MHWKEVSLEVPQPRGEGRKWALQPPQESVPRVVAKSQRATNTALGRQRQTVKASSLCKDTGVGERAGVSGNSS